MISFTMKILGFQGGTYTVEYTPEHTQCKPIKLNIQLDQDSLNDKDQVVEKLKASSPQEYWYNQVVANESNKINEVARSLLNTSHAVHEVSRRELNPVNSFSFHPVTPPLRGPQLERVNLPESVIQAQTNHGRGHSTPEQVSSIEDQNIIKLKILIQQVLQEMAEGTV